MTVNDKAISLCRVPFNWERSKIAFPSLMWS